MLALTAPNYYWGITGALGLAAIGSYAGGFVAAWLGRRLHIMDKPGSRSSHSIPTPRTGGVAILFGAMAGLSLLAEPTLAFAVAAAVGAVITAISFIDDVATIPSLPRLALHFLVAGLTITLIDLHVTDLGLPFIPTPMNELVGFLVAMLFVVGFVNFFNFMDGINGISAAQGIWGGLTLAALLAWGHGGNSVIYAAAIAGGCLGFMPHNFPTARIFMGDIGSTTIGFVLATLTLVGSRHARIDGETMPWVCFILPLGVFIYDAVFTLAKRIGRGENPLKAHREHHYQLLVRSGWSHTKVTCVQMGLMTLWCIAAFVYAGGNDAIRLMVLGFLAATMAAYSMVVHRYFQSHRLDRAETVEAKAEKTEQAEQAEDTP